MKYEKPKMEILKLVVDDVIRTSDYEDGDAPGSSGSGSWAEPTN